MTGLRWEWRTEADLEVEADDVAESDEVYFLSDATTASVKLRDGRLDVKVLDRVENGLQLWRPVVKAELLLDADAAEELARALGVRAVEVHKRRAHFTVGGAMAERAELTTVAGTRVTVAVESEDPQAVLAAVRELGLEGRPNVSVPATLKSL